MGSQRRVHPGEVSRRNFGATIRASSGEQVKRIMWDEWSFRHRNKPFVIRCVNSEPVATSWHVFEEFGRQAIIRERSIRAAAEAIITREAQNAGARNGY